MGGCLSAGGGSDLGQRCRRGCRVWYGVWIQEAVLTWGRRLACGKGVRDAD